MYSTMYVVYILLEQFLFSIPGYAYTPLRLVGSRSRLKINQSFNFLHDTKASLVLVGWCQNTDIEGHSGAALHLLGSQACNVVSLILW